MQVTLNYGKQGVTFELPSHIDATILGKPPMPVLEDPRAACVQALGAPVDSVPLEELARSANTACIAICDITRPVPNHLFLRPMIEALMRAGMPREKMTVLVATGLHRPNEGAELAELIGDTWVLDHVRVVNHDARNDEEHRLLGTTTTRGTAVRIDRRFVDADLRIVTGLVEPHFMAGYSGGRKVIAPGIAHAETITTFHNGQFMANPAAANCSLANNPLHEEQLEIVRMLPGTLALNTVIDEQRRLAFVNFGEILASHAAAIDFVRPFCEMTTHRLFSTVVTSAAGYPLDKTYYQTVKGMVGALEILASGGDLIIASECSEGLGSPEFADAQRRLLELGPERFLRGLLAKSHAAIDEWQTQMQLKAMEKARIYLYAPLLDDSAAALTGVHRIDSVEQALAEIVGNKTDRSIAIIPEGPYVVPRYAG